MPLTTLPAMRAHTIATELTEVGAKQPKEVADALKRYQDADAAFHDLAAAASSDNFLALMRTMLAGEKPATEDVLRVLMADALARRTMDAQALVGDLETELRDAVAASTDAIARALVAPFDKAAEQVAAGRETLGDIDLDDLEAVTRLGGNAAQVWQDTKAALAVVNKVVSIIGRLEQIGGYPSTNRYPVLVFADLSLTDYRQVRNVERPNAWNVVRAGLPLALANAEQYASRAAALEEQWAASSDNNFRRF